MQVLVQAIEDLQRWYNHAYDVGDALWTFTGYDSGEHPKWTAWALTAQTLIDPVTLEPSAVRPMDAALLWAAGAGGPGVSGSVSPWTSLALGPGVLRRLFVPGVDPPMTQAELQEFGSVVSARGRWEAARGRVGRLLDVVAAWV